MPWASSCQSPAAPAKVASNLRQADYSEGHGSIKMTCPGRYGRLGKQGNAQEKLRIKKVKRRQAGRIRVQCRALWTQANPSFLEVADESGLPRGPDKKILTFFAFSYTQPPGDCIFTFVPPDAASVTG